MLSVIAYVMGPQVALEIGRRQIIWFCSNILDKQQDPTMLAEIEEDELTNSHSWIQVRPPFCIEWL